jgi:hypothetical protein
MIAAARDALVRIDHRVTDSDEGAERVVRAALVAGGYCAA